MNNNKKFITSLFLSLTLTACFGGDPAIEKADSFITKQVIDKTDTRWKTTLTKPPLLTFTQDKDYFRDLQTNQGKLTIKL